MNETEKTRTLEWGPDEGNMTWDEAMKLAASKGDGWRLPTVQELVSQFDYDKGKPAEGFRRTWYWSSSPDDSSYAWNVNFDSGGVSDYYRLLKNGARCVRWAGDGSTDRQIDSSRARYAAELRALANRIERGE